MRLSIPALLIALGLSVAAGLSGPLLACLWDKDTLASESRGAIDVIRAISGRFDRDPPLYYELRLARSARSIEAEPTNLLAYDDAGVASDRLHRGDEAIAWMERKVKVLDQLERERRRPSVELRDQRYRYLANVGTFWVHRWARSGADRSRIDEVKTARDFIAGAIALNHDAHFGREAYQLKALGAIIDPPTATNRRPGLIDFGDPTNRGRAAVDGLAGLVVLGDAWESVDVFDALAQAIETDGERASVAMLAQCRAEELIDAGRRSLLPDAPAEPASLKREMAMNWRQVGGTAGPEHEDAIRRTYRALRDEADAWQSARTAFMTARLREGRHPDTDQTFWDGYVEPPAPPISAALGLVPPTRLSAWLRAAPRLVLAAMLSGSGMLLWVVRRNRRQLKGKRIEAEV